MEYKPETMDGVRVAIENFTREMSEFKGEMKDEFKMFRANYVPITVFLEFKEQTKEQLKQHEEKVASLTTYKDSMSGKLWGIGITLSIIWTIIGFAVSNFLK